MRLIDADKFEVVSGNVPDEYDVDSYLAGNNEILEMIDNAPTVDAEIVRHGYWIEAPAHYPIHGRYFVCSVCGNSDSKNTVIRGHYCWFCGSKMDGVKYASN